jgi:hypothetical protein
VPEVADVTTGILGKHELLFAIWLYQTVEPAPLAEVTVRFPWSAVKVYDISAPGTKPRATPGAVGWAAA